MQPAYTTTTQRRLYTQRRGDAEPVDSRTRTQYPLLRAESRDGDVIVTSSRDKQICCCVVVVVAAEAEMIDDMRSRVDCVRACGGHRALLTH